MQNNSADYKDYKIKIVVLGRRKSGKTSFINLITGKNADIDGKPSALAVGTREITQNMYPIGSLLWFDTSGFSGDNLSIKNQLASLTPVLNAADAAVLVCEGDKIGKIERALITNLELKRIPLIVVFNKADTHHISDTVGAIAVNSTDLASRDKVLQELKDALIRICPEDLLVPPVLLGDLAPRGGLIVMIVADDYKAPQGRLILPQIQAIRDCINHRQAVLTVTEKEYANTLKKLKTLPDLVICDSDLVTTMVAQTPLSVKCTTFAVLTARMQGDLQQMTSGALALWKLKDGDKVLIAEPFKPEELKDDVGTVKIPRQISEKTGKDLIIDHMFGSNCPIGLENYNLVVHRGLHLSSRREYIAEQSRCAKANVPLTNYSVCISELNGALETILRPFPNTLERYKRRRDEILATERRV
jgi:[FeFe] hydrogenase H-cluster maturation GTPase HydF